MDIDKIMARIPNWKTFLTVDEMDDSTYQLQREYPDLVKVSEVGRSRKGHPLLELRIGDGSKHALVFACPHPNEPIGVMTSEFLTRLLAEDHALREELGYTWHFIKCVDPDGVRLNEAWFKGPFNIYNYSRNFFRPVGHEQVEWTFPIDYKEIHFHNPLPETQALMRIMDQYKPSFVYSLHNAGFGGAYWYITRDIPHLYPIFYDASKKQNVAVHLGEPESPSCVQFAPAVYGMMGARDEYDFVEKFTGKTPEHIDHGTSSSDYATGANPEAVTFLTELPYFFDPRIQDMSPGEMSRRDAVLHSVEAAESHLKAVADLMEPIRAFVTADNPFVKMIDWMLKGSPQHNASKRAWAMSDPEFEKPATVASIFDNTLVARFYEGLTLGLSARTCEYEIERIRESADTGCDACAGAIKALEQSRDQALEILKRQSDELESAMNYEVIAIRRLVGVQVECGLSVAAALRG